MKRKLLSIFLTTALVITCFVQFSYADDMSYASKTEENILTSSEELEFANAENPIPTGYDAVVDTEAQKESKNSFKGSGFAFNFEEGVLTIRGSGTMPQQAHEKWADVKYDITKVEILEGVTSISAGAFYDCYNLEEVVLPEGLTTIEAYAFQNTALKTVNLPTTIESVDSLAFFNDNWYGNSVLESFTIGGSKSGKNSKYSVKDGVLYSSGKASLYICPPGKTGEYTISSLTTKIQANAFLDSQLTTINFPEKLTTIKDGGFARSAITKAVLPNTVTSIGDFIFEDCTYLKTVDFGTGLKKLGYRTCSGCNSLTKVYLRNLTDLDYLSFAYCQSLTSVSIPKGVKYIKNGSFGECSRLATVKFLGSTTEIWYQAFLNCKNLTAITLPSSMKNINRYSFYGTGLTSVKIPANVIFIGDNAFPKGCKLTNLSNTKLTKMNDGSYDWVGAVHVKSYRDYTKAFEVLTKVNKERKAQGLGALKMDKSLLQTAMLRASETAVYWSHTRPLGNDCFTANSKMMGENIAVGQTTASYVMTNWMDSPGHKANILGENYKTIGIGCVKVNGIYYWVQNFGTTSGTKASKSSYSNKTYSTKVYVKKTGNQYYNYKFSSTAKRSIKKGKTTTMGIRVNNTFAYAKVKSTDFTYKSSNSTVASVTTKGKVTGKKKGTVTITAKLKNYPAIKVTKKITIR